MKIQISVSTQNFNVYRKIILTPYYTVHSVHFLLLLFLYILLLRYLNGILHNLFIFLNAGWLQLTFTLKNRTPVELVSGWITKLSNSYRKL